MEEHHPSLKAINLIKESELAYLEVYEKHGEAAAVFACKRYLDEYDEVAVDAAQQTKSNYIPESGLSDEFLDELEKEFKLPCVGLFGECKSREITDEQVRNLFEPIRKARGLDELPACIDFDKEFEGIERGISTQPIKNGNPSEPYRPKVLQQQNSRELPTPTVNRFERTQSPPRKMSAYSAVQADDEHQTVNNFVPSKPHTSSSWTNQKQSRPKPIEPPEPSKTFYPDFKSATHKLNIDNIQKHGTPHVSKPRAPVEEQNYHPTRKLLGGKIRANPTNQPFKDPTAPREPEPMQVDEELEDPLLKGIDPAILEKIKNEVIGSTKEVHWEDIAGLEDAKCTIKEAVVMPLLRPDFFTGLRSAPKGILLFGPPGTGKTLIGKCIASQANATFFSISASSLTSKWIGEGEKLVKALFVYARVRQPSVIFLDEIDSVLTKRSENENEATRRLKTEFLVQLEGAHTTTEQDRVLLVGATNRPQELDDAARRRFTKRLYIPLPDFQGRLELIKNLLKSNKHIMSAQDLSEIASCADGFSGSDMKNLCAEASMFCLRELPKSQFLNFDAKNLRPINIEDFRKSLTRVKASVSQSDLQQYIDWDRLYGSTA